MKPHDSTVVDRHIAFIAKQRMHHNDWPRALVHLHCDEPQRMIWRELSRTSIVMSWSERKQSKHGDVADLSRATCHVYGRNFGTKLQRKRDEKYVDLKRKV